MALEYFLYNTGYSNTLIARSDSSFAPLPPDTGEIYIDYFIPEIQPLYLYRESGGTIVYNNETIIDNYIQSTIPEPQENDSVFQYQFTGYTDVIAPSTYLKLDQNTPQVVSGGTPQFESIQFNTDTGLTKTKTAGKLQWNTEDNTLEFGVNSDVTIQIGQEQVYEAYNNSGLDIANGQLVNVNDDIVIGGENIPTIELTDATKSPRTLGMTTQNIPNNSFGYISNTGKVRDLNTSGYTGGTLLYLSIIPGEYTSTPPPAPYYVVPIGLVSIQNSTKGEILFQPKFGYKISDMADVSRSGGTTTGQILTWDSALEYYRNDRNINDYLLSSVFSGFTGTTDLQTVTEIGSTTNIESSFSSGIITNRIKPTGDTETALQITKSNGTTAIINVDTVSGFTGFGTIAPEAQIHVFGTDNCDDTPTGLQTNGIRVDGNTDTDKDIQWADNGEVKWLAEIYRNEGGRFWYLYNQEGDVTPFVSSASGRVGINTPNDVINKYGLPNVNSGLDDIRFTGIYDKNFVSVFQIEIDSVGTPDTFAWRVSYDEGITYGNWTSGVTVSTGQTLLESGVYVYFLSETGHTVGNSWEKPVFPQLPSGTFTVHPNRFEEIILTDDYTAGTIEYNIYTGEFNSSRHIGGIPILVSGDTSGAFYVASTTKLESVYFNLNQGGENITLIAEYWNGTTWVDISIGSSAYFDNTHDLSVSGIVKWDSSTMTSWVRADIPDFEADDQYFWIRFRSSSNISTQPVLNNVARGGNRRFGVYSSPYDYKPAMYVDTRGNINIGGGSITRNNHLQINDQNFLDVAVGSNSLVEMDSCDPDAADLRMKLVSDDACSVGIAMVKTRGDLCNTTTVLNGDELGHIWWRAKVGTTPTTGATLNSITSIYTGDGTYQSLKGDLLFNTANGGFPIERVRITASGNTGFGISVPTAVIHLQSGTTSTAPLRFTSGALLTTPQEGAMEFLGDNWYGTITGGTRKTFAFLESPEFTGTPILPTTTELDGNLLTDYILNSGGSNNTNLVSTTDFNTYTGTTDTRLLGIENDITYISGVTDTKLDTSIFNTYTGTTVPWDNIDFSGSTLADLETRDAVDVDYTEANWEITNVKDGLDKLTDYNENILGSGRISPQDVISGLLTDTINVSGGTGFINYENFHKKISWSADTFSLSGETDGIFYVYVDSLGNIQTSSSEPNSVNNILLGIVFWNGVSIGSVIQSGSMIDNSINRQNDFMLRLGNFIYDGGGKVGLLSGNTLQLTSPQAKVQVGSISVDWDEIDATDASTYKYRVSSVSADVGATIYYYLPRINGEIPTNRWNDTTQNAQEQLTAYTLTFTNGSNIVSSVSDLTSVLSDDDHIYLEADGQTFLVPISGVSWSGSLTTITLENTYLGAGGSGTAIVNRVFPKIPAGKYGKSSVVRMTDNVMIIMLTQQLYDNIDAAVAGPLPGIPSVLQSFVLNMAYLAYSGGTTDLTGSIYDIRPLPFSFREGGQTGGGTVVTIHGDLTGLAADDHLQYLRTDGTRALTGIQKYQSQPTFTTDLDIVTKKYVDDADNLKLNVSTFSGFTGTTLPANYYNKTEIDSYTASTLSDINNRLLISNFNIYTGVTAPQTYLNLTGGTITSDLRVQGDIYLTGTTPTTQELKDSYLLGAITTDGRIIKSNSSVMSISQKVVDITVSTGITELYGIYYVDTTIGDITLTIPDTTASNDGSRFSIVKKAGDNDVIITTVGGTQNIGNQTSQTISQTDKGLTIVSDDDNTKWLVVQDSRFLEGSTDGELQYWDTTTGKWKVSGTDLLWSDVDNSLSVNGSICGNSLDITGNTTIGGVATFIGAPVAPTATINNSSTQIATTEFVLNQAANTQPSMAGISAIGTSLRYARQDHVHPTDTSRFAATGGTITGSVAITGDLGVSGTTILSATTIGSGLIKYDADYSATYDDRTLVDKAYADGIATSLIYLTAESAGDATTTSLTDVLMTGMQITNVPAGTYLLSFGTSLTHGSNNSEIYTNIYVGNALVANSEMFWRRGNANISNTHNYANHPITLAATATVDIRWRTDGGTATSVGERYLTLLRVM